jgi:NAD(P)-dependent dehydrogenase (short-subunit alcohol dehydrogenase family)
MTKLKDRVAIVTGATSGMGEGIAKLFAQHGARVVLGGREEKRGREVVDKIRTVGGEAVFVPGDVATPECNQELVTTAVSRFRGLDIVVASAGILGLGTVTEVPLELWNQTLRTNLDGVFFLLRFSIPEMEKRGGGAAVIIGSIAAYKGFPGHAAYCASKGALVPFVKQVALDYGPAIRVNLLCPGPVDTPLLWSSAIAFPDPGKAVSDVAQRTLLKRLGTPTDIANAALFLAGSDSNWITGTAMTIDGGIMTGA